MAANDLAEARRRSQSRASTSSLHSASTQPNMEHSFAELYSAQWLDGSEHHHPHHPHHPQHPHHPHPHSHPHQHPHHPNHQAQVKAMNSAAVAAAAAAAATGHQLTPEDIILQAASQLDSNPDFSGLATSMNTSLVSHGSQPFHHHGQVSGLGPQSLAGDSFSAENSFAEMDSQMTGNEEGDSSLAVAGTAKPSRSSANNELEMRQLFNANQTRSLQDVAEELHGNERGPNSERTRQVFAMLWINQVCSKGKGSVPRGRVYANYASRCATERITVLNPASFGKLVRVLFPGLKTRRLGVRGESKYHYVNFQLAEDEEPQDSPSLRQMPLLDNVSFTQNFNDSLSTTDTAGHLPNKGVFQSAHVPARQGSLQPAGQPAGPHLQQRSALSQQQQQQQTHQQQQPNSFYQQPQPLRDLHETAHKGGAESYVSCLYNQPDIPVIDQLNTSANSKTIQNLFLASTTDTEPFSQSDPLVLPRIDPFLPSGTDPDAAKSLAALYRSHCTSLVECIRYCKEKTFFHLFTSFQGTLTMPVQKLFANPSVAPWIEECDFVLYQRMMRIISGLTLQVVPKPVLDTLRSISERLVPHIRDSFQGQPLHVIRAKEAPATLFAGLLDRALRVNLTAHAAANMLSNPANRDQMYLDWITLVRVRKIAECIPARGMDDMVNLLLTELRGLLDPASIPWEIESMTLYGQMAARNGLPIPLADGSSSEGGASNVLDRWVNLLQSLPGRFPYATHRDIVWCVQRVGTAVMRDLTIQQGKSFGSWWVTKCWIDEMVSFLAEQGGFLRQTTSQQTVWTGAPDSGLAQRQTSMGRDLSRRGARYRTASEDSSLPHVTQSQPDRAPFPSAPSQGGASNNGHDVLSLGNGSPDDSGIGIRTPDEDFTMEKFGFSNPENQDLMVSAGLQ